MAAAAPMIMLLALGESGSLGGFGESRTYGVVRVAVVSLTLAFYFVVTPFFIWPRLFGRPSREALLRRGGRARGRVGSVGDRGAEHIRTGKGLHTYLEIVVEVETERSGRVREVRHLALVPDGLVDSVRPGMEVALRVDPDDPDNIAVDWGEAR